MANDPLLLILDVDTGVDDCVALLYALAAPDVELVAVTCCAGNVTEPQAAANTLAVLELGGAGHVEVAPGSLGPLVAPLRTATGHGPQGLGYATLPPARAQLSSRFGPDLLVEEARRRPGEIVLVATGPLTNVALAVRREPELPQLLRRLVVMGGAFEYSGNTTPTAEFNVVVDPEAARVVLDAFSSASRKPVLCGLNITEQTAFRPVHLRRLAELAASTPEEEIGPNDPPGTLSQASNPVVRCLSDALRFSMEAHARLEQGYVAFMHDPLAVAAALDESLGETRPGTVDVELSGTLTRAHDRRRLARPLGAAAQRRDPDPRRHRTVHDAAGRASGGPRREPWLKPPRLRISEMPCARRPPAYNCDGRRGCDKPSGRRGVPHWHRAPVCAAGRHEERVGRTGSSTATQLSTTSVVLAFAVRADASVVRKTSRT